MSSENDSTIQASAGRRMPPNAGKGRPAGVPNKVTREFRETVQRLLDENQDNVQRWLAEVAEGTDKKAGDPAKALDLLSKLAEYASPKLARTEVSGLNGQALEVVHKVELVSGNGSNPPSA